MIESCDWSHGTFSFSNTWNAISNSNTFLIGKNESFSKSFRLLLKLLLIKCIGSSHCCSVVANLTSIHEDTGWIPGPAQWIKDLELLSGVSGRCSSDLALLWLWHRLAATAPIRYLAWKLLYVMGEALKRQKVTN